MGNALQLGPLLLPYSLLLVFASVGLASFVGNRLARRTGVDVESLLWRTLLVAVVVARLGFVYEFRSAYLASPLDILDIRDGGWNPTAGLIAGWFYALSRRRDRPELSRPLRGGLLAGTLVFLIGTAVLSIRPETGQALPSLSFESVEGETVRLDQFSGRPTVVNLWATWCPPCVREMPVLQKAQVDHPEVHFVFLNQGEPAEKVKAWLASRRLDLANVLIDGRGQASAAFEQKGFPTTLFFGSDGRLKSVRIGELSPATLEERLSAIRP